MLTTNKKFADINYNMIKGSNTKTLEEFKKYVWSIRDKALDTGDLVSTNNKIREILTAMSYMFKTIDDFEKYI